MNDFQLHMQQNPSIVAPPVVATMITVEGLMIDYSTRQYSHSGRSRKS